MLLTLELLPLMLDTAASPAGEGDVRIIFVSSGLHYRAADFNAEKVLVSNLKEEEYDRLGTYSITKLYNVSVYISIHSRNYCNTMSLMMVYVIYTQIFLVR